MKICKRVKKNLFAIVGDPTALRHNTKSRRKRLRKLARHIYECERCQDNVQEALRFLQVLDKSGSILGAMDKDFEARTAQLRERILRTETVYPPG